MKALQALGWYYPDGLGGTENYVAGLSAALRTQGVDCVIAAPSEGGDEQHYTHDGFPIYRYPVISGKTVAQNSGAQPHTGFERFEHWLDVQAADVYHQHSWTYGCGSHHLRAAHQRGIATVLTVHVPGFVCLRGTMLRDGRHPCDGVIRHQLCAACWLGARGAPPAAQALLSRVPPGAGGWARGLGRAGTAFAATSLVQGHRASLLDAAASADHVIAVCQWLFDALLRNGVPRQKLTLSRQGVSNPGLQKSSGSPHTSPLIIGFLGRWDPLKGIGLLVEAFVRLPPDIPAQLHICAIESDEPALKRYMETVSAVAAHDPRIKILPFLPPAEVPAFLSSIDVLAVPSQGFETGPLVVLEALSAGTPVIGSDLGGISELVGGGRNGWLVPFNDVAAWAVALQRFAESPAMIDEMRNSIGSIRTMNDVALETKMLYEELASRKRS